MKKHLLFISINLFLGNATLFSQKKIDVTSELGNLREVQELPRYTGETKLMQVSSYDTAGGNDDEFSGKYSFIRRNPDSTLVIFEERGKGVIKRIWTPTPSRDTLDFYFRGSDQPSFSIRFLDLFSGDVFPFVQPLAGNEIGGYYNYFPNPFEDGCRIVFRGKKLQFYQIQHRSYPEEYRVKNFSPELSAAEKEEFERLK